MELQKRAYRCDRCGRWLRSRGGLALHRCVPASVQSVSTFHSVQSVSALPEGAGRSSSIGISSPTAAQQANLPRQCGCGRRFR